MTGSTRIGIIGGGASAVCLLDAMSQRAGTPSAVTVFEPSPHLWRGRAYQPDSPTVRVNAPPDDMSVRFGDVEHFESWVGARDLMVPAGDSHVDRWSGVRFVPRPTYGDYLEQSARAALSRLVARNCEVDLLREAVIAADRSGEAVELLTSRGEGYLFDYVVLCVGGARPADTYRLTGEPGFVPDPYPVARQLSDIEREDDVAVIGSGLTAVDVVLALAAQGHRGRILALSRRGVLPAVRQRPTAYELRHFTPARFRAMAARRESLTLDEAVAVMRTELAAAGVAMDAVVREVVAAESEDPLARLRRQFARVDDPWLGLRILQRAVPDTGPDVWPLLSEHDRSTLLQHHYRTIMSLCCPMPPASAATLLALAETGQFQVVRGLEKIAPAPGSGFRVEGADGCSTVDVVVNAVNAPAHRIPPRAEPLISSLTAAGVARRHPRGGLFVERATSRVTVDGTPDPRVYALGDLAAGSLFFTFGVPSLVDRASDIAEAICSDSTDRLARRGGAMQTV